MDEVENPTSAPPGAEAETQSPARRLAGLRSRRVAFLCVLGALAGVPSACGGSGDGLAGRWDLVAVDEEPVSQVPSTRLGGPAGTRRDWFEEELISRSIEIGEGEGEFLDRRVLRRTHVFPPGSIRRSDAPPTRRVEGVDTIAAAGTVEFEGDTIRFEPGTGTGVLLVGTRGTRESRDGGRLRLTAPDGTHLTFERAEHE